MLRSWRPLGPVSVVVPAVAIVVVVVAMTWPMLGWPYPLWVQTSAQFHQQVAWAGLIAGPAACWYAIVFLKAQDSHRAVIRHLMVLIAWLVGAYLVALSPLVMSTVVAGGIGTPDPLAMLSGVLAMVAAVALGYAAGALVPSTVMVPVVTAGFYVLLVVGSAGGERYAAVSPVLYREPQLGQHESLPLQVFRIALFVMIAVAAAGLAGRSCRRIANVATYSAAPVALIIVSLIHPPVVFTADDHPPTSCTDRRGIHYCVHADNQPRLADLVRTVDPVIARYGTKPANLDRIWDQALTLHPIDADLARGLELAWLNPDGTIETSVAATIAGVHACAASDDDGETIAADVSAYLSTGNPSGSLSAMSVVDVQRWIAQHQEQLHTCTLDQLPGTSTR